ncbi:MAG: site-specific integrase [Candidatus Dormiibacterota bacterium]
MTSPEAQGILDAFESHRLGGLVTVILGLGLRLVEALGLQWSEVNFEQDQVRVVATLQRFKGEDGIRRWELRPPKSEESNRTLPLPASVAAALQGERSRQRLAQLAAGPAWQETGFVFTSRTGEPWSENGALHAFQNALAAADLPRMRLHDLRHGTATLLLAPGVPARVVMEILGHSQISMTLNTYSHVIPELMGGAAKAIDSAFARG